MGNALTAEELYKDMPSKYRSNLVFSESFGSWGEFLDATERPTDMNERQRHSRTHDSDKNWDLGLGWEGTKKLAREGWPEGTQKLSLKATNFINEFSKRIKQQDWFYQEEAAGNLDIAKFLDGEPEVWNRLQEKDMPSRAATVVLNMTAAGSINAKVMEARGLLAANLVQALEAGGVRTRVILAVHDDCYTNAMAEIYITLKDFGEPLDIDNLVFAVVHPATFRRLFFSYMETWSPEIRETFHVGEGYGRVELETFYKGDIYFGKMNGYEEQFNDEATAEAFIKERLKEFGVELKEEATA